LAALNEWASESDEDFWEEKEEADNVLRTDRFPKEIARNEVSAPFTLPMLTAVSSSENDKSKAQGEVGEWIGGATADVTTVAATRRRVG
jgi:hypothetical protein